MPNMRDMPKNIAELLEFAKKEACSVAEISIDKFDSHHAAKQFAVVFLSNVQAGDHPYCRHGKVGMVRANLVLYRKSAWDPKDNLRKHHPGWVGRAERKGSRFSAIWD